jgi:methionine-rich copper-binding protein CopC
MLDSAAGLPVEREPEINNAGVRGHHASNLRKPKAVDRSRQCLWREGEEMTMRASRSSAILFALLLLVPVSSWPHAYLVKSSPPRRALLARPPTRVQLWFNERLEAQFSQLSVWDASERQVDNQDVQVDADDAKKVSVGVPDLPSGTYHVKFRVLSVDGHIAESDFPFTIRSRP